MLGGKIWLESEIEKGTTVSFTIPLEKSTVKETKKEISVIGDIDNKIILIAEDNEFNYLLLEGILSKYNLKILHAWNGKEAINIFKQEKQIDLILMDLKMPLINGYEALKEIRKIDSKIPIIAQTAYASVSDKETIRLANFNDFIAKPINSEKLVQIIKENIY